ncbi:MAG TPA: DUF2294 domain-containing protein [Candidatus Janibacter merdipullorum]|nr:DUF2294 domain-containing protein [Candidatus Janibacter merdipullorum]
MDQVGSPPSPRSAGEWKQEILRLYNRVNQDLAGSGVDRQRVHLTAEHIVIVAQHHRVPALRTISSVDAALGRWADAAIVDATKARLKDSLVELGVDVVSILKDYDPDVELAATIVVIGAPLPGVAAG